MSDYVRGLRERVGNDLLFMPSAHCLLRDDTGRILLVRHFEGRWQLPGGAVEPGETPADAARRECWEETGLLVEPTRIVGLYGGPVFSVVYRNGDHAMWVMTLFAGRVLEGEPRPDGDETTDAGWFGEDELDGLEMSEATRTALRAALGGVTFEPARWMP